MRLPPMMRVSELARRRAGPMTLGRLLALALGGLAVAVMAIVWLPSAGLLRDQAEEQALARVRPAGFAARDRIRRDSEDALIAARQLAIRPTLRRLVIEGRPEPLVPFLQRFCTTATLDSCAVLYDGRPIAISGRSLPWSELLTAAEEQGERFLLAVPSFPDGLMGSAIVVPELPGVRVVVARLFDERLEREMRTETGEDVRLLQLTNWIDTVDEPMRELHSAALTDGQFDARRVERLGVYAASVPVLASTGEGVALIEVRLPVTAVESAVGRFLRRLALIALIVGGLAVFTGVVLGRRVARPLRAITRSAVRLGQGDFSASIPVGRQCRDAVPGPNHGEHAPQPDRPDHRAAPARSGGTGRAHGVVEGVFAVDAARIMRYANPQAARMLGLDPAEVVGRFCGDVLRPIGPDGQRPCETSCPIVRARSDGSGAGHGDPASRRRSRRTVVITSAEPVEGQQVQVMRDETELEAVRRARDFVLANIAHEFRTPLAAQLASIELLQRRAGAMSTRAAADTRGLAAARRAAADAAHRQPARKRSYRVRAALASGASRWRCHRWSRMRPSCWPASSRSAARRSRSTLPTDLPDVQGDAPRLTQVFVNLLANANKFAPEGSTIRVGGETDRRAGRDSGWKTRVRARRISSGLDLRALPPLGGPGAGAARARSRALDRALDRRAARRHGAAEPQHRPIARGSRSRCQSRRTAS